MDVFNSSSLTPEHAEAIGLAHEDFTVTKGKNKGKNNLDTDDSKMDMVNNKWGIMMARKNRNLDKLEFEELFYNAVKSQSGKIRIIDTKTIPQQTLRETINYRTKRYNEVRKELKATEHLRLPSLKW